MAELQNPRGFNWKHYRMLVENNYDKSQEYISQFQSSADMEANKRHAEALAARKAGVSVPKPAPKPEPVQPVEEVQEEVEVVVQDKVADEKEHKKFLREKLKAAGVTYSNAATLEKLVGLCRENEISID